METPDMTVAAAIANQSAARSGILAAQQARFVADMRAFLGRLNPQTTAESLRLLRNAYPEAPLGLRVAACGLGEA